MAEKLGLESVEELENALDSLEGIAPDGGPLDDENLAREARVRSAYLEWCKEYGKEPDESRFPTFESNYLEMEEFAKDSGKEMVLNEYADFTEAEFVALQNKPKEEVVDTSAADAAAVAKKAEEDSAAAKVKAEADAAAAKKKEEEEAAAKAKAEADASAAKKKKEEEAAAKAAAAEKGKFYDIISFCESSYSCRGY